MFVKYSAILALLLILMFCLPLLFASSTNSGGLRFGSSRGWGRNLPRFRSLFAASNLTSRLDPYNQTLKLRIAAVEPVFTTTAYSSFYRFYAKFGYGGHPTRSDLALLNASLVTGWSWSEDLRRFFTSKTASDQYDIVLGRNLSFITEINVTQGALFGVNGKRNYDVLILGFTEYVTAQEYYAYKMFVTMGGALILMDATNFLAEVKYYPGTQHLALIRGHGWGFNGTTAWRDIFDRWQNENTNWLGGTFGVGSSSGAGYSGAMPLDDNAVGRALKQKYGSIVFTKEKGHEENVVTNLTRTSIIANWVQTRQPGFHPNVSTYVHYYRGGVVADLGVMGSDVIISDESVQFYLAQSVLFVAGFNLPVVNPQLVPATTSVGAQSSGAVADRPMSIGDAIMKPFRDRMMMRFILVAAVLLVSFLVVAVWLRRREHKFA